ncbi:MAG: PKD domain-containing protein [Niabella sp.]
MPFALTKKWGILDFKVWMSLLILSLISLALLGYKVATTVTCPAISIKPTGKLNHANENSHTFFVNEQIIFSASTSTASKNILWNFGDDSEPQTGTRVTHIFAKEGNYMITVTVDGKCTEALNIRITEVSTSITDNTAPNISPIVSNDIVSLGEEAIFNTTAVSSTYTWSVDEQPELGQRNTPTARFVFNKPGNTTISLLLSDGSVYKRVIQVTDPLGTAGQTVPLPPTSNIDLPPAPIDIPPPVSNNEKQEAVQPEPVTESAKPAKPEKTYEQLPLPTIKAMIVDITEGKKGVEDFNKILCNGAGTKVMANNEATTFAALCNALKEKKGLPLLKRRRKIENVKIVRDQANGNCVSILYVDYK